MTIAGKKRIIKKFEQLTAELVAELKSSYPDGFEDSFITFQTPKGELELALPLETEEAYYLIKMPKSGYAEDDDDYDGGGSSFPSFDNFENLKIEGTDAEVDDEELENIPDDGPDENDDGEDDEEDDYD